MSRALDDSQLALTRLRYAAQLWALPLIPNLDVPVALGISLTAWTALKGSGEAPPTVAIGRRTFVRSEALRAWVDRLAIAPPLVPEDDDTL